MSRREHLRVRILRQPDDGDRRDVADFEPAERLRIMWQLARDAWAFKGEPENAESRLQRHVVRIHRGGN